MAGRPHALADPEFAHDVAAAFADGLTREEMCDLFGVRDPKTITRWRRDPRVQTIQRKIIQDRVLTITSKTDSELLRRLQNPEKLSTKELIEIRKEFLGGQLRDQTTEIDEATVAEAMSLFEDDPEGAEQLRDILRRSAPSKSPRAATEDEKTKEG